MKKVLNKITALFIATMLLMVGMTAFSASAAGDVSATYNQSTNDLIFTYRNVDTSGVQISSPYILISSGETGSCQVSFGGANVSGRMELYKNNFNSSNKVASITIPKYISGMPTLYSYVNFSTTGKYYVKFVSDSGTMNGSFTFDDIPAIVIS